MAIGLGDIFSIGASILGDESSTSYTPTVDKKVDFSKYMYETKKSVPQATTVGGVGKTSADYTQFLRAWDDYLSNDYLEMSKRIMG
jgi:hypothetical protein